MTVLCDSFHKLLKVSVKDGCIFFPPLLLPTGKDIYNFLILMFKYILLILNYLLLTDLYLLSLTPALSMSFPFPDILLPV